MTKDEALKLALDYIVESNKSSQFWLVPASNLNKNVNAIKEALAQPEQEPVGEVLNERGEVDWISFVPPVGTMLYTTPPHRKPLSNQKIIEMYNEPRSDAEMIEFARAIEAAHGIWPENSDCYGPDWTDRDGEYLK